MKSQLNQVFSKILFRRCLLDSVSRILEENATFLAHNVGLARSCSSAIARLTSNEIPLGFKPVVLPKIRAVAATVIIHLRSSNKAENTKISYFSRVSVTSKFKIKYLISEKY